MKIKIGLNNNFQIENKTWIQYLINVEGFHFVKKSKNVLSNTSSFFSSHPATVEMQVDISNYPEIQIEVKNWVLGEEPLQKVIQGWVETLEERVFDYSRNQEIKNVPKASYLLEKSIGGIAELFSHLFLPSLLVILSAFGFYVLLCFFMIKTIAMEMKYDPQAVSTYLSFAQLPPDEIGLYATNQDFLYAAILLAFLGGGFLFGAQQLLICLLLKFWSGYIQNKIILLFVLGCFQGMLYFLPTTSIYWLIFVPVSFFSYFLFSYFSRKMPFNISQRPL